MKNILKQKKSILATTAVVLVVAFAGLGYFLLDNKILPAVIIEPNKSFALQKFASDEEFINYFQESAQAETNSYQSGFGGRAEIAVDMAVPTAMESEKSVINPTIAERVSETNVQVTGIDEPDIVKTDGENIFVSSEGYFFYPMREGVGLPAPELIQSKTKAVKALPPAAMTSVSDIAEVGNLLLVDNTLVIFASNKILGYDVARPEMPVKLWEIDLSETSFVAARLVDEQIYLITRQTIDYGYPCPVPLMTVNGSAMTVACTEIYRPSTIVPIDTTYTALRIDPRTGSVANSVSFVGSTGTSVVYVSNEAMYITFSYQENYAELYYNFFREDASGLISEPYRVRLAKLADYDISAQAKFAEISVIIDEYKLGLGNDDRLKFENDLNNQFTQYLQKRVREIQKTGIVKVSLDNFDVSASSEVAGQVLNQFSLDEFEGNLRVATTSGSNMFGAAETVNDVYVLDSKLKQIGSLEGLGLNEQIYSVRFLGKMGYVVTFRQTDPFYVIDLSAPKTPRLAGELKIPGYSSYLHPISEEKVLGVGQEGSEVKLSMFDVSDPNNPMETDKYLLNEYWSEVSSNHHSFLQDARHEVFFMPGGNGGYVFSYANDELSLTKAVSESGIKRALFINDFMYLISESEIVVLDENNWNEVGSLDI